GMWTAGCSREPARAVEARSGGGDSRRGAAVALASSESAGNTARRRRTRWRPLVRGCRPRRRELCRRSTAGAAFHAHPFGAARDVPLTPLARCGSLFYFLPSLGGAGQLARFRGLARGVAPRA